MYVWTNKLTNKLMGILAVDILACDKASLGDQVRNAVQVTRSTWSSNISTMYNCAFTVPRLF